MERISGLKKAQEFPRFHFSPPEEVSSRAGRQVSWLMRHPAGSLPASAAGGTRRRPFRCSGYDPVVRIHSCGDSSGFSPDSLL